MEQVSVATGTLLAGRYAVERELGRGGMASVYLGQDTRHGRPVAIKVMHADLSRSVGADRFQREIAIAARLQHPHILPLFDSGEQDGILYYVMPFIDGESLRDRITRERHLPVAEATRVAGEVAGALAYAHERGVVHRDIKPENILLSKGGAIVADFGIARATSAVGIESLTSTGMVLGSPTYMSPEQYDGSVEVDGRADLYALGCVLYEMLAGMPPFVGPNIMSILAVKMTSDPTPLRELRQQVPIHLERAVSIAMSRTPVDRFRNGAEFAAALVAPVAPVGTRMGGDDWQQGPSASRVTPTRQLDAPNLGPLVSRMCDRWRQVNSFDASFRESQQRSPGCPQVHVVHGPEGESHDSLVERLVATRLNEYATEIGGEERGTVKVLRVPWPDGDTLETRQRDLAISLFREVASGYMGNELTALTLSRQPSLSLSPIVVIHHDIRTSSWDGATDEMLHWYLNAFWGALIPSAQTPLFVVFLKVIYEPVKTAYRFAPWRRSGAGTKQRILATMQKVVGASGARCAGHISNELTSVTENDVKDWFNQNGIYGSERKRHERAASMFRGTPHRPMSDIEVTLEEIRNEFVRQHSHEGGEVA